MEPGLAAPTYNRRLTDRVLGKWIAITEERRLPRRAEVSAEAFGNDWSACAVLKLASEFSKSQFVHLGDQLPLTGKMGMARLFGDVADDPLFQRVGRIVLAVISTPFPTDLDGAYITGNQARLFRCLGLPISEDNRVVDHVLIAISHRDVPLEKFSTYRSTEIEFGSVDQLELLAGEDDQTILL